MLSNEDFLGYFSQLQEVEDRMAATYEDLAERLDRPELKEVFKRMSAEERQHATLVKELMEMLVE